MKMTRRKILFGVMLLFALLALWPELAHDRMKAAVAAYKRQLRAQGEKLTIDELIPPTPTNGANGAAALLTATRRLPRIDWRFMVSRMKPLFPARARVAWAQEILPTEQLTNLWPELKMEMDKSTRALAEIREAMETPVI
jgi:hypothetical protein